MSEWPFTGPAARTRSGAAAAVVPLSISVLRDELPPRRRGSAMALMSSTVGIGAALGLPPAAVIVQYADRHTMFRVTSALGAAGVALAPRAVRESPVRQPGRFDVVSVLGPAAGLVCLLLGVPQGGQWGWGSVPGVGLGQHARPWGWGSMPGHGAGAACPAMGLGQHARPWGWGSVPGRGAGAACRAVGLFARVMSFATDTDALLDAPVGQLGPHMVRRVLVSQSEQGADPLLRIVFAPLHGEQGDIPRANFRAQVTGRLTARLTGADAGLRAELAVAALLGLGVMCGIARGTEVRAATVDELVDRYAHGVQTFLTP